MDKRPIYWIVPNVISKKEILNINKIINKKGVTEEEEKQAKLEGKKIKYTQSKTVEYFHLKKNLNKIMELCYLINNERYGFDVNKINFYDCVLSNNYKINDFYGWHTDIANDSRFEDLKLTALLNISTKPYEGGNLEIFHHTVNTVENFNSGNLILFQSSYNHRVTPILKGERMTLTMFLKGPLLR
jgi:predicted 2-oxoglutarate/Fe(II)-dependent dioxygenase YbiX